MHDADHRGRPPLLAGGGELTVALAGLAIGGAERIVLDWASRIQPAWRAHRLVLRDSRHEWAVPSTIRVTRLAGATCSHSSPVPVYESLFASVSAARTFHAKTAKTAKKCLALRPSRDIVDKETTV